MLVKEPCSTDYDLLVTLGRLCNCDGCLCLSRGFP